MAVYGQVVVCPGVNDGGWLEDTLCGVLESYAELRGLCLVPLGVSRHASSTGRLRPHTRRRGSDAVLDATEDAWQEHVPARFWDAAWCSRPTSTTCWRGASFLPAEHYEGFDMHEDGVGIARNFLEEFMRPFRRTHRRADRVLRLGGRRPGRRLPGAAHVGCDADAAGSAGR